MREPYRVEDQDRDQTEEAGERHNECAERNKNDGAALRELLERDRVLHHAVPPPRLLVIRSMRAFTGCQR